MSNEPEPHIQWHDKDGIAVVEVLSREIRQPGPAQDFGRQLYSLLDPQGRKRILINFHKTRYLGSTAFAVLFNLAKMLEPVQGQLKVCCMHPDVLMGASVLSLGQYIGIYDDEKSALASF
jgi:anti-sigma B factor antagonist